MSENLNNPVNVLYVNSTTSEAVAVSTDNPLPCTNTINATIGDWAVATAVAPTIVEGTPSPGSVDLTGRMRVIDSAAITLLTSLLASIGAAGDAAGANTVIGQLKQININTTTP